MVLSQMAFKSVKNLVHGGHGSLSQRARLTNPLERAKLGVLADYLDLALLQFLIFYG
jgi:hypothetical protein